MHILYVVPGWPKGSFWDVIRFRFPPLAIPTLCALTPPGHRISFVDESISPLDPDLTPDVVAITAMIAARGGRIVAISSISGQTGESGQMNYSAAKAGLIGAAKALAREMGRCGILVNVVAPGLIATDMTARLPLDKLKPLIPLRRAGTPEEVAGAVGFLLGPKAGYITGQVLAINGGLYM